MSSRGCENLSDLKLIGGTIKLAERPPSNSHSSSSKRFYCTKFSSRPSSAFPRLYSGDDNSQNEIVSAKKDPRPFSADFVMPNPLGGKSKETLTDGSFESIYVPVDFQLPSSNLFKELLEEDIEQWRKFGMESCLEMKGKTLSEHSIPTLVTSDSERSIREETTNTNVKSQRGKPTDEEMKGTEVSVEEKKTEISGNLREASENEINLAMNKNSGVEDVNIPSREEMLEDKYVMTPGLTSKPPLPRKHNTSQVSIETEKINDDPIYDYFAIKYNLVEGGTSVTLKEIEEKSSLESIESDINADEGFSSSTDPVLTLKQREKDETEGIRDNEKMQNMSQAPETKIEFGNISDNKTQFSLNDWLEEINMDNVHLKESETDKYIEEVRKQCNTSKTKKNLEPLLSEIDIDDLFKLHDIEEGNEKTDVQKKVQDIPKAQSTITTKDKAHKLRKKTKSKSPTPKKQQNTTSYNGKKQTSDNNEKEIKSVSKSKFTAMKLNKIESPKHELQVMEENIETWIEKDVETPKRNRVEFSELIDSVEELKSTTAVLDDKIANCPTSSNDDMKQENYDDIETIIEALENQGKTSKQNIQTMKRIVTSELSNSIILNESEENLLFRKEDQKRDQSSGDSWKVHEKHQRNDSQRSSSLGFSSGFDEKQSENCAYLKNHLDSKEISKTGRSQSAEERYQPEPLKGIGQYRDLLSYLDEVDKKCNETLGVAKERAQAASKLVLESSGLFDTIPKVEDLLTHSPEELSSFVIDLSLRVKDKTSCIGLLQNELSSVREKLLSQTKQAEATLRQKLKEQKEETEKIAKRHQKFIDQLMEEKKTMARKCEELVEEMHLMEDKYVSNMKAIEHRHQVEMQKMKEMHAASEKLRRERWIEGRTQKIKEMAVKSIEPEVERMDKRHQEELSNLRMVHKREIEELELRASRKLQEHSEKLREQLIEDREKALAHERDVMRLRYEKMVESEERNYQDQRRRLQADHSNRLAECEEREAQAAVEKERAIKQAQEEYEEKLQAATRRHANEMKIVKETAAIEMENWKNSFRKQQTALLMEKETAIRRECKKERDREIEIVIEKLENEANKTKSQIEQTAENRIKRLRDKYEMEIKDLEMLEKDAQTKYCESRSKILEYEEAILTLRNTVKQLEHQLTEEKVKSSKLESEREGVREEIRKEYEDKVVRLERETEELRNSADKQVEQLYSRVRVSLARKDELLAELTNDHKALKEKCLYLENMMEQQRKEYMINS